MTGTRRALALSLTERYLLIVLALASSVILARLLTPQQIGVYSVSMAIISIAQVLRDFGIGNFLIQEKDLSDDHIRTAFGLSLLLGSALFAVVFLGAPLAGRFYSEASMVTTLRIASLNFLVLPFSFISLALLRRDMQFKRLLYATISAATVGSAVTITCAYAGLGQNSLAIGSVVTNAATGLGAWYARHDRKLIWPSLSQWRALLNFGAQSSSAGIMTTISMDINDLALGNILGFSAVAMINRAQGLMNLFHRDTMAAIRNVAFPSFSRAHRNGQPIEPQYIDSVTAVTVIAWPFYGFTAIFSFEIVRLMFGDQWDAAVPLVPLFCLAGAAAATTNLVTSALMAVGRMDLVMQSELIFQPLRAITVVLSVLLFRSLLASAISYLLAYLFYVPFIYSIKQRCLPTDYRKLLHHLRASALVTATTLAAPLLISFGGGFGRIVPAGTAALAAAITLAILGWLIAVLLFRHPITADPAFQRIARMLRAQ